MPYDNQVSDIRQISLIEALSFEICPGRFKWYTERLIETNLSFKSVYIRDGHYNISEYVPVGEHRRSGFQDPPIIRDCSDATIAVKKICDILRSNDGFPNPRLETFNAHLFPVDFIVWGHTPPCRDDKGEVPHVELGTMLGYKEEKIEEFMNSIKPSRRYCEC